jgi:metal-responsive CopG/Arc/MetJ family transcriptional regulator
MATTTGISIEEELLAEIDRARQLEGVRTGDTPSRSAWFQDAAREKLEEIDCEEMEQLARLSDSLA